MTDPALPFRSAPALAEALRRAARDTLPRDAFLRIDRGEGLFVAGWGQDPPEAGWAGALVAAGFSAVPDGRVMRLAPAARWLEMLAAAWPEPPDFLCQTLRRFDGPPDADSLSLFALGAKGLYGMPDPTFERRLRQRAAVCLRAGGGGGLYACALLLRLPNEVQTR